jgi:Uma2 family endonuclease
VRGGDFLDGAPVFAVEIKSKNDYGAKAERQIAQKRAEYFACGTKVFWDVDVLREKLVRGYRADAPDEPKIYRKGDIAEAAPALPGWSIPLDVFIP